METKSEKPGGGYRPRDWAARARILHEEAPERRRRPGEPERPPRRPLLKPGPWPEGEFHVDPEA
jgi:hypothetical protein